jgi:hypothetical protein
MASVASHVRVRLFSFAYRLGVLENSSVAAKQTPRGLGAVTQQNLMSAFACITDVGLTTPHVRKVPIAEASSLWSRRAVARSRGDGRTTPDLLFSQATRVFAGFLPYGSRRLGKRPLPL